MSTVVWSVLKECPFQMLHQHALCVQEAMNNLCLLFEYGKQREPDLSCAALSKVHEQEQQADQIKQSIRKLLNERIYIPVNRRDLLDVLFLQDSIANQIEDISGLFYARQMEILTVWEDVWDQFLATMVRAVQLVVQINEDLSHIIEAGFHSRMQTILLETVVSLDECEHLHDQFLKEMRLKLYDVEATLKPIDVWFYYQFLDRMGNVTDLARRLGFQLISLVTR